MLTIASVSPTLQVRLWTQHEWRDCFRKTDERSQYFPWKTGILQRLCTLGINMSDRTSQILTSRDCSFTFLTVYTRKKKWVPIIYGDRRSYRCAPFHSSSTTSSLQILRQPPPTQKKMSQPAGRYDFWFWDAEKVIPVVFIYLGTTISARTCCDILRRLREAVRKNRPHLLSRGVIIKQHYSSSK